MDFTSALERYRKAVSSTQNGALIQSDIDVRLDMFAMFYWGVRCWPMVGMDIPEEIDPVTTLERLSTVLPSILESPVWGAHDTLTPASDEAQKEYLRTLHELVMAKAKRLYEIGGTPENRADIEDLVRDPKALEHYVDWEVSAGSVLGEDHGSTCNYIYCRSTNNDADEQERDWAWRVSFSYESEDLYIGDLAGFLYYYPNIYDPETIQEEVDFRIRDISRFVKEDLHRQSLTGQ
ncbi:hypothetical protein F5Y19DRAFT_488012 [Xylariaceae sp. FL1651]|nr:hypothetical protein F5Y19DRAFT_488012 [Xylariaceae sp. FL1651]